MVTRTCAPLTSSMVWLARVRKATFHGCFTCIPRVQFSNSCAIAKWHPMQYGSHVVWLARPSRKRPVGVEGKGREVPSLPHLPGAYGTV